MSTKTSYFTRCDNCGYYEDSREYVDKMAKNKKTWIQTLVSRGWLFVGRKSFCPDCDN